MLKEITDVFFKLAMLLLYGLAGVFTIERIGHEYTTYAAVNFMLILSVYTYVCYRAGKGK